MIDDPAHAAMRTARVLGLPQEALRLGCNVVGTEHLLMATLCDPVIRWKVKGRGVDMRDVQSLVRRTADERRVEGARGVRMTDQAADLLLVAAGATVGLDPDRRPDPDVFSASMIAIMVTLLHDGGDTAAGRILIDLGLVEQATALLEALTNSATAALLLPSLPLVAPDRGSDTAAPPPGR